MGQVVPRWFGREAKALREAKRMSVRDFAAYLGVNDAAVSNWERRGDQAQLRYETQQLLDAVLQGAPADVYERFALLLTPEPGDGCDAEIDVTTAANLDEAGTSGNLGGRSAERSRTLLDAASGLDGPRIKAPSDTAALKAVRSFTASSSRAFVMKGPPGSGKTHFTREAAREQTGVDFQLHSVDTWNLSELDLAAEILRYASLPQRDDPLLTLESAAELLTRPCLVVIDGINAPGNLNPIGRQLDAILRQVPSGDLRFMLVIRTPPDGNLTAYPLLASSIYEAPHGPAGTSHLAGPWDTATARHTWDHSRGDEQGPAFDDLPPSVQTLARLPLYMHLMKAAGNASARGDLNAYHLLDHCVTSILDEDGHDSTRIVDALAERALAESPQLTPPQLDVNRAPGSNSASTQATIPLPAASPLFHLNTSGEPAFTHDVIREYFLARRIAELVAERGHSAVTVTVVNDLASQAMKNPTARGIFEFVVFALDDRSPALAASIAMAPTASVETTLPLMFASAASGARFATDEVLRVSAKRCVNDSNDNAVELAGSLLMYPTLPRALADHYEDWLLSLLRQYGSAIWPDVGRHIENSFDFDEATRFLARLNFDTGEEATFLARYYFLFTTNDTAHDDLLEDLAGHMDWRVRTALAQGLLHGGHASAELVRRVVDRLAEDADYKVRAAVARSLGDNELTAARTHLANLLNDPSWHVRACVLDGTYVRRLNASEPGLTSTILDIVHSSPSWHTCSSHIAKLLERLRLLERSPYTSDNSEARGYALLGLLRELRTGWIDISPATCHALVTEGLASPHWLVRREARALCGNGEDSDNRGQPDDAFAPRQTFRRLRGSRAIQVALDIHDLDRAIEIATAAASAGTELIEVGDPLIKTSGLRAVEDVKRSVPETTIVAEMMSADWGRGQVELAAEAGADIVQLIGPATIAGVSAAVEAGWRRGVAIVLEIPATHTIQKWVRDMERTGVDGIAITSNIDLGVGVHPPLTRARTVRGWTLLPVAVSGGFSATDYAILDSPDWDIMIVGRSVAEAVQPAQATREVIQMVRQCNTGRVAE